MKTLLDIRPLENSDIESASELLPIEWNFKPGQFLSNHSKNEAYRAFGGFMNEKLVCFGDVIINKNSGWLGNIVVSPDFRTNGFGQAISLFLVNFLKKEHCGTIHTMASDITKVNYQKLGFLTSSVYCILKGNLLISSSKNQNIRLLTEEHVDQVYKLDNEATHEDRSEFLKKSVFGGWVYVSSEENKIKGFYLPDCDEGPIIASDTKAGLQLLLLKHSISLKDAVIPCENKAAVDFLKNNHFKEMGMICKMVIGEDLDCNQEMIFSRAGRFGA